MKLSAVSQGFSINRYLALVSNTVSQCGSMAAKRRFHGGGVERRMIPRIVCVSWGFAPFQVECLTQT